MLTEIREACEPSVTSTAELNPSANTSYTFSGDPSFRMVQWFSSRLVAFRTAMTLVELPFVLRRPQ